MGDVRHQCLRSMARVGWSDAVNNVEVRNLVLGSSSENNLSVYEA